MGPCKVLLFGFHVLILLLSLCSSVSATVSYDHKAIIINGQRRILISGSIHYPRSTPEMWPDLIQKAKDGGLDVIQTYVFWNGHEPTQGQYYFEDRYDLVKFIKLVHQAGIYVHLRIGPYICGEWNFGGIPVWLKFVPGIEFRTDNGPFKAHMQRFTTKIVEIMKSENLFQTQGGPIILSQIENEYGPVEWEIGAPGKAYTNWAANMAVSLNTGVPWVMCKQEDVPAPILDACNGFYCENYESKYPTTKPKMWTEVWTGWYTEFGKPLPTRPVEDIAYSVARFVQNRGSFFNYYMYHGGSNFGRTAGGPFFATSYDYDAPLDEYGLPNEPKYSHLRDLHKAIKQCEPALISVDPKVTWLGKNQEAHVFEAQTSCSAFLANYDPAYSVRVTFRGLPYDLPPWSVSILPDCKSVVFNTAKVGVAAAKGKMFPTSTTFGWQSSYENVPSAGDEGTFTLNGLSEQLKITWDKTDYLWYLTDITINQDEAFLKSGQLPHLEVMSAGHAMIVFVNGQFAGTAYGTQVRPQITFSQNIKLHAGVNKLALLSVAVGLANVGTGGNVHYESYNVGVLGPVTLKGLNSGSWDMSKWKWSYKIGLRGEASVDKGSSPLNWVQGASLAQETPLTWYKSTFNAPAGNEPLALDMHTMGKGLMWINGQCVGRHWPAYTASGSCGQCNYAGIYDEKKCSVGCGAASQRWYHVPRSWLKPTGNLLVVFEEYGGDPKGIALVKRTM